MLEISTKNGRMNKLVASGDVSTLAADMTVSIYAVYNELKKSNKEQARLFKMMLVEGCKENGLCWLYGNDEDKEQAKKQAKKIDINVDTDKPLDDEDVKVSDSTIDFIDRLIDILKGAMK